MEYNKSYITEGLKGAALAVASNKHVLEYSFLNFKNGLLITQNGFLVYQTTFASDLNCFVSFSKFKAIINKAGDDISLTQDEDYLIIKSNNNKTKLRLEKKGTNWRYPKTKGEEVRFTEESGNTFYSALEGVAASISDDLTTPILTGVHMYKGNLIASNRRRVTLVKIGGVEEFPNLEVTMRREVVDALLKLGVPVKLVLNKKEVTFDYGDRRITSRLIEGDFPQSAKELGSGSLSTDCIKIDLPVGTRDAIDRVSIVSQNEQPVIKLSSDGNGKVIISADTDVIGTSKESLEIKEGLEFDFLIDPNHLKDALIYCSHLYFVDSSEPVILKTDDNKYLSIIALTER